MSIFDYDAANTRIFCTGGTPAMSKSINGRPGFGLDEFQPLDATEYFAAGSTIWSEILESPVSSSVWTWHCARAGY